MYQKENIVSQINACQNFPTNEMNKIQVPTKEEVIEYFNEKLINKKEEFKSMDFLECELDIRKKLNDKVNNLVKEKDENIIKLKEFEKFYGELPNYLNNLENSTLKSQNYLNLNFSNANKNLNLSGKLPSPLFVLYNLVQCFNNEFTECEVNIKGEENKVDEFYNKYSKFFDNYTQRGANVDIEENEDFENKNKEEGEHSEGEIEEDDLVEKKKSKKKKRKRRTFYHNNLSLNGYNNYLNSSATINSASLEDLNFKDFIFKIATKDEKFEKFPLYIELIIKKSNFDDNDFNEEGNFYPLIFNFFFIPVVNLISVQLLSENKAANNITNINLNSSSLAFSFKTNQILSNIFIPPTSILSVLKEKLETILCNYSYSHYKYYYFPKYFIYFCNKNFYNFTYSF